MSQQGTEKGSQARPAKAKAFSLGWSLCHCMMPKGRTQEARAIVFPEQGQAADIFSMPESFQGGEKEKKRQGRLSLYYNYRGFWELFGRNRSGGEQSVNVPKVL